jgi:hypothetical protein
VSHSQLRHNSATTPPSGVTQLRQPNSARVTRPLGRYRRRWDALGGPSFGYFPSPLPAELGMVHCVVGRMPDDLSNGRHIVPKRSMAASANGSARLWLNMAHIQNAQELPALMAHFANQATCQTR